MALTKVDEVCALGRAANEVIDRSGQLARAFRKRGIPVVLVNVSAGPAGGIFLTGMATSAGVEATVRSGYDLGCSVELVVDAMKDRDADTHSLSVEKIFPRIGETATTSEVRQKFDAD